MAASNPSSPDPVSRERALIIGVLGVAMALRLAHLSSAMLSPLTYQPGPDEDYYQHLGQAVAAGGGHENPELTFMDPAYGYWLGGVFRLFGVNLFVVYLLQALVDTATVYAVFAIGSRLEKPRAGLYGALLYALTPAAIMFSTTMLKETWVTSYMTWWVVIALTVLRDQRILPWLAFGFFCGTGVALRSTLLGMAILAMLLPFFAAQPSVGRAGPRVKLAAAFSGAMVLALIPWSIRNYQAYGSLSPLPHNAGIVLHQAYNEQNPSSANWIPPFVNYLHPSEIWRGYAAEASRREGRALSPTQVDHYWRAEALHYMRDNPGTVLQDMLRKAAGFFSATEVPNNRSSVEERLFSPVLRILPILTPWLLALGVAGLLWLAFEDRRWLIVAVPIGIAGLTFTVFWAEDRFRFHALGVLAFCSGYWVDRLIQTVREAQKWRPLGFVAVAGSIAAISLYLGSLAPPPTMRWDHIVWGYLKMGKPVEALSIAQRVAREQPDNAAILEALGYIAAARQQYSEAEHDLQRAIVLRPRSHVAHYNLARVFLAEGDRARAESEARTAVSLNPAPDYQALLSKITQAD